MKTLKQTGIDLFNLINKVPFFNRLDKPEIIELFSKSKILDVDKNYPLFFKGDEARYFYIIIDGWVKVFNYDEQGNEIIIAIFTKNDVFAEVSVFDGKDYPVSAISACKTRLLAVESSYFRKKIEHNPKICFKVLGLLSKHLRYFVKNIEHNQTKKSHEKLAHFLCSYCKNNKQDKNIEISIPIEKKLLASKLNMKPETLSRSFTKLKKFGVTTKKNKIYIKDIKTLCEL